MNWLDITILILLGISLIKGLYDGMIKQVVSLAAMIIGIYLCAGAAEWLSGILEELEWFPQSAVKITSYFLGFIIIAAVVIFAGKILDKIVDATPLGIFNHLVGGIIGVLLMVIFVSFLLNVIEKVDRTSFIISNETKVESRFYESVKSIVPTVFPGDFEVWHKDNE